MHKKILVLVDDRVVTQSAIRQSIAMAGSLGAAIHFFYVLSTHETIGIEHAQKMLAAACELAERSGVLHFKTIGSGADSARCVSDAAAAMCCELIVVGNEGKNAGLRILSASVVPALISLASVPVLVCRDTGSEGGFGRRSSVSIRARQKRLELMERRIKEFND